jgi:hypothetical protein
MQTVWMGSTRNDFRKSSFYSKVVSVIITFWNRFNNNLIQNEIQLDWHGIMWGMLAAASLPPQCLLQIV